MSKVISKEVEYKNYGKCIEISNGIVKLIVTVDLGPRIINYSFVDGENIMWEDINRIMSNESAAEVFGSPWYIYGGHRLWASPEALPRTYYADNEPIKYETVENGVRFIQGVQKWNQYQCEFTVTLCPNCSDVRIDHKITNCAAWDVNLALWPITVLSQGGIEIVPQPTVDTGLLGNRLIALWPYTKLTDKRLTFGDRYIALKQDTNAKSPVKFGINSEHGFAMYFNHGDVFVKKFDVVPNGTYPDGGMSFETYTSENFLEMESLGEYKAIAPGKCAEHTENWSLFKAPAPDEFDESKIDELVEKYVR